ncbi:MAG: TIGR02452 family protein [Deltaproteobacteria bacterium]|nr:TIGR02452 family protein [Deltaproteobacteria bacterium]
MSLAGTAKETLVIVEAGHYVSVAGVPVDIRASIDAAVQGTRLFTPDDVNGLVASRPLAQGQRTARIEVAAETTALAARRLGLEGEKRVLALNFASAKNPGGGFLGGARAQEEDLARCSALYSCQLTQRAYYDANRATDSMLYTDHLIWSPGVPFFRDERLELLDQPFLTSIVTSPAPNAGEALRRNVAAGPEIRATLERRAAHVLAVAAECGHRVLVLGAWGCGVFRNDPREVSEVFDTCLSSLAFAGAFDRVVFAIPARGASDRNLSAFRERFETR